MTDQTPLPPPGWYPDAEVPAGERWWNGASWSEERRAAPAPVGPPPVPYDASSPYVASPYAPAPYGAAGPSNTPAIVGFSLSVAGMVVGWLFGVLGMGLAIAGLVVSIVGLRRAATLRAAGHFVDRRGFALAGVILGGLATLGTLLLTVGLFVFMTAVPTDF